MARINSPSLLAVGAGMVWALQALSGASAGEKLEGRGGRGGWGLERWWGGVDKAALGHGYLAALLGYEGSSYFGERSR